MSALTAAKQTITLKMGDQGRSELLCSFYHEPLPTSVKTNINKFGTSSHTAFKLDKKALRSYLKLTCEYELHILPNTKVSAAKDHGENYMKARPPWSAIFSVIVHCSVTARFKAHELT